METGPPPPLSDPEGEEAKAAGMDALARQDLLRWNSLRLVRAALSWASSSSSELSGAA